MAILERVRISVSRTINLGNYNSVKVEATVDIGRDKDTDTPEGMRLEAVNQAADSLDEAMKEFAPKPKGPKYSDDDR